MLAWAVAGVLVPGILGACLPTVVHPIYNITDTARGAGNRESGLYAWTGKGTFRRLGGSTSDGIYSHLYTVPWDGGQAWVLGFVKSTDTRMAEAHLRSPTLNLVDGIRPWQQVHDGSHAGKSNGVPRYVKVEEVANGASLGELEATGGILTNNTIVCQKDLKDADGDGWGDTDRGRREWTFITKPSPSLCDGQSSCTNNIDETTLCFMLGSNQTWRESVVVSGTDMVANGVYHLQRRNEEPWYYSMRDHFIYRRPGTNQFAIGQGNSIGEAVDKFRSNEDTEDLNAMTWNATGGPLAPLGRVIPVPEHITKEILMKEETWADEMITEQGDVLCNRKGSNPIEKLLILVEEKKDKCGQPSQCEKRSDQSG